MRTTKRFRASGSSEAFWIVMSAFSWTATLASARSPTRSSAALSAMTILASCSIERPMRHPEAWRLTSAELATSCAARRGRHPASSTCTLPYGCWQRFLSVAVHLNAMSGLATRCESARSALGTRARRHASTPGSVRVTCASVDTPPSRAPSELASSVSIVTMAGTMRGSDARMNSAPSATEDTCSRHCAAAARTSASPSVSTPVSTGNPCASTTAARPVRSIASDDKVSHASLLTSGNVAVRSATKGAAAPIDTASVFVSWFESTPSV
mmetsp:Transcript_15246/g.50066  ORF Transcript_15246/g.50066 Transcript_15246/m.50066 type:complete len:269 (-) Transcript_15246:210-1016(-)